MTTSTVPDHSNDQSRQLLAYATDLRRLWQAEQVARESEAHLRMVMDNVVDGIITFDEQGVITMINPAAERIFGYTPAELIGQPFSLLLTEPHSREYQDYLSTHQDTAPGKPLSIAREVVGRHRLGATFPLELALSAMQVGERRLFIGTARDITERKRVEATLRQSYQRLARNMEDVVNAIALTVEIRDPYTAGHQRRVSKIAQAIATEMGLAAERVEGIRIAGLLHDIGKIYVPAEILSRPGRISDAEFSLIKVHPQVGYEVLKEIAFTQPIAQMVRQHHEKLDGSGYPAGLADEQILLEARILSVADTAEAIAAHRPYRPALGRDRAWQEIHQHSGTKFDPAVVVAFERVMARDEFVLE